MSVREQAERGIALDEAANKAKGGKQFTQAVHESELHRVSTYRPLAEAYLALIQQTDEHPWRSALEGTILKMDAELTALLKRHEALREAAAKLIAKMKVIHDDQQYKSVWTINQIHVGPYKGPEYSTEFHALDAALAAEPEVESRRPGGAQP